MKIIQIHPDTYSATSVECFPGCGCVGTCELKGNQKA